MSAIHFLKKIFKIFACAAVVLIVVGHQGFAADITFEASVDTNKISIGQAMQLTLTINNAKNVQPIPPPTIDGFDIQFLGPSTRISIVNGQYSSSNAFIYTLFPRKIGKFEIPVISVDIGGKTYTSQSIPVEVVDAATPVLPQQSQSADENTAPQNIEDKIFLTLETPKAEVYEGEKIPVTIKLFVHGVSVRDIQFPDFEHVGLSVDPFDKQPRQYSQVVGGIEYKVVEFNTFAYPTRTGALTLGPAGLSCSLLYRSQQRQQSPFGNRDDFFGDDFFSGFFDQYQKRPLTLKSVNTSLNVLPVPQEGKPDHFSGAVGKYDFQVTAGPANIKAGDPVTLKMTVAGDGNLNAIKMPAFENLSGFKIYDPQVKGEGDSKIVEQVLIPTTESAKEIPAISFSYFDSERKTYETITRGPFTLEVARPDRDEPSQVVAAPGQKNERALTSQPEEIGRDIIFIKENPGNFQEKGAALYKSFWFIILVFALAVFYAAFVIIYHRLHKLKTDSAYARQFFAPKKAKKGLDESSRLLSGNKQKEFYDSLFKTLQDYFSGKFHMPAGNITVDTIEGILKKRLMDLSILAKIKAVFDDCDMVRYASLSPDQNKMKDNFKRTQEIIDFLERSWR